MRPDLLDDNPSAWLAELPPHEPGPALRGDVAADVAVVGGGLTGISTAWHLSERFPERRIVVLEARSLANGASGRNGGQVLNGIAGIEPDEPELARRVHAATRMGIDVVEDLAARSRLPTGFVRSGCLEVYTSDRGAEAAQAHAERSASWGIPVEWRSGAVSGLRGVRGAVVDPTAARVNAAALVRGLAPVLRERGVVIHEETPVLRIEEGATIALATPHGTVRARAVVLATNAYTPLLGYFRSGILPIHSHVVATEPLPDALWSALGWSAESGFHDDLDRLAYGCRTPAGRLVFGGGSNAAYAYRFGGVPVFAGSSEAGSAAVERRLREYLPGLEGVRIAHRWTGTLAITFDRVCAMGVTGASRNVFYALGYSGHGLALAALAGRVLRDLYSDDPEPWRGLPFLQRRLPRIPPEPLRWLGYQVYTRLTGRSPRRR